MKKNPAEYIEAYKNYSIVFKLNKTIYSGKSEFHAVDIVDTKEYGKALFLDNFLNSSELDEFIYHELIVHPAMITHPNPKKVLIIGGGEGATLREVLKHGTVEKVFMVDIDGKLVELCKKFLPEWSNGAFNDPRAKLIIADGRKFLEETKELFDVIILDLSDPVDAGPACKLFTQEFYRLVFERLSSEGIAVIQAENLLQKGIWVHARMYNTLKSVFPIALSFSFILDSFHESTAFILCSKKHHPVTKESIERLSKKNLELNCFSEELLKGIFFLPKYVYRAYAQFPKIITDKNPLTMSKDNALDMSTQT